MKTSNNKKQFCVYCNLELSSLNDTRDHVFPKNLFTRPYPDNLLTVPACLKCNGDFSPYEEYFKHISTLDENIYQKNEFKSLGESSVYTLKKHTKFYKRIIEDIQPIDLVTPNNIFLGRRMGIEVNSAKVDIVIKKIIKGLVYIHSRKILDDQFYKLGAVDYLNFKNYNEVFHKICPHIMDSHISLKIHTLGNVAKYRYKFYDNHFFHSTWSIHIYDYFYYIGIVFNNKALDELKDSEEVPII